MALFDFTKFEKTYTDIMKSEEWLKACDVYKSSKIILLFPLNENTLISH